MQPATHGVDETKWIRDSRDQRPLHRILIPMPEPTNESSKNDFEQQKWLDEIRLREKEIEIKAKEAGARSKEAENTSAQVAFTRDEARRNRWTNPLVVAVFAAAIAGAGNAIVALLNGNAQRETEEIKDDQGLILEAIKANSDPDKAAANLRFLVDTALISNSKRRAEIQTYLKNRKPGEGPALPSASGVASVSDYNHAHIFRFDNRCPNDIKLAVYSGISITSNIAPEWFNLSKGETLDLTRIQATLFYYAETIEPDKRIWSGEQSVDTGGKTLHFKRVDDSSESRDTTKGIVPYQIALSCLGSVSP
jgi:hypothetical protein